MTRSGPVPAVLADPRIQFGVGMAVLLATASEVRDVHLRDSRSSWCCVAHGTTVPGPSHEEWEKHMKFLMLVCVEEDRFENDEEAAAEETAGADTEDSGSFPWLDDVMARGIRLDGDRLRPPREAKTVLVRDGEILVSDGPFAETKEIICGYDVLECATIEEAVQVAAAHPVAAFGKIEVRQFWR